MKNLTALNIPQNKILRDKKITFSIITILIFLLSISFVSAGGDPHPCELERCACTDPAYVDCTSVALGLNCQPCIPASSDDRNANGIKDVAEASGFHSTLYGTFFEPEDVATNFISIDAVDSLSIIANSVVSLVSNQIIMTGDGGIARMIIQNDGDFELRSSSNKIVMSGRNALNVPLSANFLLQNDGDFEINSGTGDLILQPTANRVTINGWSIGSDSPNVLSGYSYMTIERDSNPAGRFVISSNGDFGSPQGALMVGMGSLGSPGAIRYNAESGAFQGYSSGGWGPLANFDPATVVLPEVHWFSCGDAICYQGNEAQSLSVVIRPNADTSKKIANPSSSQYSALGSNTNTVYTNKDGEWNEGLYELNNINIPSSSSISEVKASANCKVDDSNADGFITLRAVFPDGAESYSPTYVITDKYGWDQMSWPTNPKTGKSWTQDDINSLKVELGLRGGVWAKPINLNPRASLKGDSLVLMADGTHKEIQTIVVGDEVVSYNILDNVLETSIVEHLTNEEKNYLTINDKLTLSPDHLVYVLEKGYVLAENVAVGDYLIDENEEQVLVNSVSVVSDETITVYDISVDKNSNFFAQGYLVHNAEYDPTTWNFNVGRCQELKVEVFYSTSAEKRAKINAESGDVDFIGDLRSKTGNFQEVSSSELSTENMLVSGTLTVDTLNVEQLCLNGNCINDWADIGNEDCIESTTDLGSDYFLSQIYVSDYTPISTSRGGTCRDSCALENPNCGYYSSVGWHSVPPGWTSSMTLFDCDIVTRCYEDTVECNYPTAVNLMKMAHVTIGSNKKYCPK